MSKPLSVKQAATIFRRNFIRLRKEKGYSQGDIQELTGILQSQVSDIETGKANPSVETICRLAEALDCGPVDLLTDR